MKNLFTVLSILFLLTSCKEQTIDEVTTFTDNGNVNIVVEIPAGTNRKLQYDKHEKTFLTEKVNGRDRIIDFLPYPGNYGFVPGTKMSKEMGGDGDPMDAIILCESLSTSAIMECIPLGMLKLIDNGEVDYKLVCIPADPKRQTIKARTLSDLQFDYPAIPGILSIWFINYKGFEKDKTEAKGWLDEVKAMEEIRKWTK